MPLFTKLTNRRQNSGTVSAYYLYMLMQFSARKDSIHFGTFQLTIKAYAISSLKGRLRNQFLLIVLRFMRKLSKRQFNKTFLTFYLWWLKPFTWSPFRTHLRPSIYFYLVNKDKLHIVQWLPYFPYAKTRQVVTL